MIPKGPTITPKQPSYGIYNNILLGDKRRGVEPAAVAPMGKLTMTGENDMFVLLEGVSPAMFMPMERTPTGKSSKAFGQANARLDFEKDLIAMTGVLENLVHNWHWFIPAHDPSFRSPTLPKEAFHKPNQQFIVRDYLYRYQIFNMADYTWWMTDVQDAITRFRLENNTLETRPVGLALLQDATGDSGPTIHRPRDHISLRDKVSMRMMVPREDYVMRHKREAYKWQLMVAAAARKLMGVMFKSTKWSLEPDDYMAWAAYTIGAYAGFNTSIDDETRYTAEDVLQDTLSYLALPFSDIWPDISLDEAQSDAVKEAMEWLWMLNTSLSMAGKRVGGKVVTIQYMLESGNIHLLKSIIPMYLKSPINVGGGDTMWLTPAVNTSAPYGVFFPSPIWKGTNFWEPNIEEKYDAFSDMIVDRGRMEIPDLDALKSNYRLITTRDSMVRTVREHGIEYGQIVHKIQPNGFRRATAEAEEVLLSYITDPTMKFGPAVFVSSALARPRHEITMGPTPLYDKDQSKKPMPGGLVDTDAGTLAALAQPTAAQTADDAAARSVSSIPVPTVTGDIAMQQSSSQDAPRTKSPK